MSEFQHLDNQIQILHQNKDSWVCLPIATKISMLRRLIDRVADIAPSEVDAAVKAKSVKPGSNVVGEEWLGGPLVTIRNVRLLLETLEDIEKYGHPKLPAGAVHTLVNGQVAVDVFPRNRWDQIMYQGFSAQVRMQRDITAENLIKNMAAIYQAPLDEGKIALVLGAGNVASIGPLDAIYKLYAEGQVCLLKMNPVNDYLGPFIEEAFKDFVDMGFLQIAYGGADVGDYLCKHDLIDEIHITGSDITHDIIVYGPGAQGKERKANDQPINTKRITSELGNVSPIIVVPGEWSAAELRFQAENIASQMANNAGFNCNAARVLITHEDWPQRDALLTELRAILKDISPRVAYYPGAEMRHDAFVEANPSAELIGQRVQEHLPWVFIPNIDYRDKDNICFTREAFCGLAAETRIPGANAADFLNNATDFCNNTLWGTLSASLIIDPRTAKLHTAALDQAIDTLRYGSVVINHWPALSYGLGVTTWGAYPGHQYNDIQSGIGVVHNTLLFEKPEKSVVYGPFTMKPRPPWFVTNKNSHNIGPRLVEFERKPGIARLVKILAAAIRG